MTKICFSSFNESSFSVASLWIRIAFSTGDSKLVSLITKKDLGPANRFGVSGYRIGSFFQHSATAAVICCHLSDATTIYRVADNCLIQASVQIAPVHPGDQIQSEELCVYPLWPALRS